MYILEGNIGAGKSTFLQLIQKHLPHIDVALEPVHNWQKKVYGQSLLSNFYQNPCRWAYSIETFAMMCRAHEHLKDQSNPNKNRIIERSIYSGHYVFAITGYENGFMNEVEWNAYDEWFKYLIPNKCKPPHGFIYLQSTPEIAYQRIKKRNRLSEKQITFAYLKQINEHHERFLVLKEGIIPELKNVPVLLINCDEEFETDATILHQHLTAVQKFIAQTSGEPSSKPQPPSSIGFCV